MTLSGDDNHVMKIWYCGSPIPAWSVWLFFNDHWVQNSIWIQHVFLREIKTALTRQWIVDIQIYLHFTLLFFTVLLRHDRLFMKKKIQNEERKGFGKTDGTPSWELRMIWWKTSLLSLAASLMDFKTHPAVKTLTNDLCECWHTRLMNFIKFTYGGCLSNLVAYTTVVVRDKELSHCCPRLPLSRTPPAANPLTQPTVSHELQCQSLRMESPRDESWSELKREENSPPLFQVEQFGVVKRNGNMSHPTACPISSGLLR